MILILIMGILLMFDGCYSLVRKKDLFVKKRARIKKPMLYTRIMGCTNLLLGAIYTTYYFYKLPASFMIISQLVLFYTAVLLMRFLEVRE